VYAELIQHIENNKASFVEHFTKYLAIFDALVNSDLMNSDNTRKRGTKLNLIKVTEFIAWAEKNDFEFNVRIKAVYKPEPQIDLIPSSPQVAILKCTNAGKFNAAVVRVINDFAEINGYLPIVSEVVRRMRHGSTFGLTFTFQNNTVSIDGGKELPIKSLERAIKRQLEPQKTPLESLAKGFVNNSA